MIARKGVIGLAVLMLAVSAVWAAGDLSGEFWFGIGLDRETILDRFDMGLITTYSLHTLVAESTSIFTVPGLWIWQDFSGFGKIGAFDVQTNLLFGPSTADYLYAQLIAALKLGGVDVAIHAAHISDAVVDGPADGWAVRLAGSFGRFDIVSITELGARIEDDDFGGMTIVHAATGLEYHYATDPIVPGQGFTGQKVTVGGISFCRIDDVTTTFYASCQGFEYASVELEGIDLGLRWLTADLGITFETQTKAIAIEPSLKVGEMICATPHFALSTPTANYTVDGIILGGLEIAAKLNGVTVREVSVLDPARFAITTEDDGSLLELKEIAFDKGHDIYPDYHELLSIEVIRDGCCGGENRFLVNTYFDESSWNLFDWAMTHVEIELPINARLRGGLMVEMDEDGMQVLYLMTRFLW